MTGFAAEGERWEEVGWEEGWRVTVAGLACEEGCHVVVALGVRFGRRVTGQ